MNHEKLGDKNEQSNEAYDAWTDIDRENDDKHTIIEKKEYQGGVPALCTYDGDRLVEISYYQYDDDFSSQPIVDVWYDNTDLYRLAAYIDTTMRHNANETNYLHEDLTKEQVDYVVGEIKNIAKQDGYFDEKTSFNAIDNILSFEHDMAMHSMLEEIRNGIEDDKQSSD